MKSRWRSAAGSTCTCRRRCCCSPVCLSIRGDEFRETLRYSLEGVVLTVVFVAAIRFHRWPVFACLNTPVMVFIGLLSYSLYLLHLAVIYGVARLLPATNSIVQGALSFAIALLLAC